jgi:arylsulfatase A-like enzyme
MLKAKIRSVVNVILPGTIIFLSVMAGWAGISVAQPADRPNVILIMTDDQGYADLACHGNPHIQTPNMDRLYNESVRMNWFYVSPVCTPTRANLMTGRYNYRTGAIDTFVGRAMMHGDETTIAEVLGDAGYHTGIFGKWHLGDTYPMRPMDQGFQESLVHNGGGVGQPSDPPWNAYHDPMLIENGHRVQTYGFCTDVYTDAAVKFITDNKDNPFFVYLAPNAPHSPLEIGDSYIKPYTAKGVDDRLARLYGLITNVDENIGKVLETLEQYNLEHETVVIFMTDNGPAGARDYTAGLRGNKGTVYEGGIRAPCFIRWPGRLEGGTEVEHISAHIDIMPTVLEACGVTVPAGLALDGRSLWPLVQGRQVDWPERTLYFQWHRGDVPQMYRAFAARSSRYKLLQAVGQGGAPFSPGPKFELYDIQADFGEQHDVAEQNPEIVDRMKRDYELWFKDVSSTRGYDPVRIYLGTPHENPVRLTPQDWRGTESYMADFLGYWEVDVRSAGLYNITVRVEPNNLTKDISVKIGNRTLQQTIPGRVAACRFDNVRLTTGPDRLEAMVKTPDATIGARYVDVERQ